MILPEFMEKMNEKEFKDYMSNYISTKFSKKDLKNLKK